MNFYSRIFVTTIFFSLSFSVYQIGDQISESDQNRRHDVCYGAEEHNIPEDGHGGYSLSLGDLNGYTNDDGVFYVTMIDMAASW